MQTFIEQFNSLQCYPSKYDTIALWNTAAQISGIMARNSFSKQYIHRETVADVPNPRLSSVLRLSKIGCTPALDLAAYMFGKVEETDEVIPQSRKLTFWFGDVFESWVTFILRTLGYAITNHGKSVVFHGVTGHIDLTAIDPNTAEEFVLEIKTTNDNYFNKCKRMGIDDERGYLTQLAAYSAAEAKPGYWIMVNKNTSEILVEKLEESKATPRLARLQYIVDTLGKLKEFKEAYDYFVPVPPSVEVYKGKIALGENGKPLLYVPYTVNHPELHYLTYIGKSGYGKDRVYVSDYNYPEEFMHKKPNIYEGLL